MMTVTHVNHPQALLFFLTMLCLIVGVIDYDIRAEKKPRGYRG